MYGPIFGTADKEILSNYLLIILLILYVVIWAKAISVFEEFFKELAKWRGRKRASSTEDDRRHS